MQFSGMCLVGGERRGVVFQAALEATLYTALFPQTNSYVYQPKRNCAQPGAGRTPGSSSPAQREELRAACTGGLARVLLHMGDVQAGKAMAMQVCIFWEYWGSFFGCVLD